MRKLSYWAHTHTRAAISLIVVVEVVKNWAGIRLGYRFFPALPVILIELLVMGLVIAALFIETQYSRQMVVPSITKSSRYQVRTRSAFCLFLGSFMLSILLGNRCQHVATPQLGDFTAQASVSWVDRPAQEWKDRGATDDIQKTRPLTRKELREERRLTRQNHPQRPMEPRKGVYVLLFVVGVILAYLGAGLACRLSCSNQGFAAVLVGLLALGALVGGIYFLVKALTRKSPKSSASVN